LSLEVHITTRRSFRAAASPIAMVRNGSSTRRAKPAVRAGEPPRIVHAAEPLAHQQPDRKRYPQPSAGSTIPTQQLRCSCRINGRNGERPLGSKGRFSSAEICR
jgi:hypothetical protein